MFWGITKIFALGLILAGMYIQPVRADAVDNFTIIDYKVDIKLSNDSESRSKIDVIETITAKFQTMIKIMVLRRFLLKTISDTQQIYSLCQ